MRARWAMTLAAGLTVLLSVTGSPASATDPVQLGSAYVLDDSDVLTPAEEADAEARLEQLKADTGVDLWVVFVDEFTNPSNSEEWATETAAAERPRADPVPDGRRHRLAAVLHLRRQRGAGLVRPARPDRAAAGAAARSPRTTGAARWMPRPPASRTPSGGGSGSPAPAAREAACSPASCGSSSSGSACSSSCGSSSAAAARRSSRRSPAGGVPRSSRSPRRSSARQAGSALVQTDDAVRTSEEELGFARAQFGDAATTEFEAALATAKQNLTQAFSLQQQLDDATPDSEQQVRAMNTEIIRLCAEANAGLDDKAAAFDELRKLEQNAPEALARVQEERAAAGREIEPGRRAARRPRRALLPRGPRHRGRQPAAGGVAARLRRRAAGRGAARHRRGQGRRGRRRHPRRRRGGRPGPAAPDRDRQARHRPRRRRDPGHGAHRRTRAGHRHGIRPPRSRRTARRRRSPPPASRSSRRRTPHDRHRRGARSSRLQSLEAANTQIDAADPGRPGCRRPGAARPADARPDDDAGPGAGVGRRGLHRRPGAAPSAPRPAPAWRRPARPSSRRSSCRPPTRSRRSRIAQRANQLAGQAIQYAQNDVGAFENQSGGMFGGGGGRGGGGGDMMGAVLGGLVINSLLGGGGGGGGRRRRRSAACSAAAGAAGG